jgi:hypothetical protein
MPALLPKSRRLTALTYRLLHPELPAPSAILRPLITAKFLHSHKHLSGFNHFELESSEAGKSVEWYNVQLYCGWGDASDPHSYDALVNAGWDPRRLVLGVVTNPGNGAGYVPLDKLKEVVKTLTSKYGSKFGGVMGWEYFNAYREKDLNASRSTQGPEPWMWVFELGHSLGKTTGSYEDAEFRALNGAEQSYQLPGSSTSNEPLSAPANNAPVPEPRDTTDANEQAKQGISDTPQQQQLDLPSRTPQQAPGNSSTLTLYETHIQRLVEMGFERAEAIVALEAVGGDVDAAGDLLFGE